MSPALSRFLAALGDRAVRPTGSGCQARCPAHDDRRASLSVREGESGRVLVHCHAGCDTDDVVRAIGLTIADLMPPRETPRPAASRTLPPSGTDRPIRAVHDYRDEDGRLLFQVVRYEPKDFRQRRPAGNGWQWGLGDVRRVLYRLPALLAANADELLFVVEGEKDVDELVRLGVCATTNPGGAGKWRTEYCEALRGRQTIVIPDNDEPGRKHAADVAHSLGGVAASVKVLELPGLPAKGDVSDWLAAGGTASALLDIAGRAPLYEPRERKASAQTSTNGKRTTEILPAAKWPARPEGAFCGPLGEAALAIEPLTEADPTAVLVQLIVAFGNAVGRGPRVALGSVRQWANLFAVIVGKSSKARKGTSWENAREVIGGADEAWAIACIKSGLSSGEGAIHAVRDPVTKREPIREGGRSTGRIVDYQEAEADPGVADKRLLVVEGELARTLKVAGRKENVLTAVLRSAFDDGNLSVLTKQAYRATGAHVSVIAHVTRDELQRELSACDAFNGFANRFMWVMARRSKELPFGERRIGDAAAELTRRLAAAVQAARSRGDDYVVPMDAACRDMWTRIYSALSADRPGLVGSVLNRAEAQVLRLALVYALADAAPEIGIPHLNAARAVWRYCEESARVIFGDALGDSVADEILRVLRESLDGMTRDELRNHFDRHVAAPRMTQALGMLAEHKLAYSEKERPQGGKGRPAERWFATAATCAESAEGAEIPSAAKDCRANSAYRAPSGAETEWETVLSAGGGE